MIVRHLVRQVLGCLLAFPAVADISDLPAADGLEYDVMVQIHEDALAAVDQPLTKLGDNYRAAIVRRRAAAQAAGELKNVIEADAALESFSAENLPTGTSADPEIARLGKLYLAERERILTALKAPRAIAWKKHRAEVEAFVIRLTKEDKIEEAKIVSEQIGVIDQTIAALTGKAAPPASMLYDTKWKNTDDGATITFNKDGTAKGSWGRTMNWRYDGGSKVMITFDKEEDWKFGPDFKMMTNPAGVKWKRVN
ncbi:hypothetical protein [Luteolibacter marinus]|uniref:hypothetical protein n=1 Tax=Luteolibacter marinus TaxID=2776705 RepID=UPI001D01BAC6|nr:hypothetical protein [Luteolibacter marinus]